jgi:F-type H+-transporting ATPase subunit gamma
MPSIKDLKKRIGTVKNTQQTTKALKMVSAAKLRRAQEAILNHRPYAQRTNELIKLMFSMTAEGGTSPFLAREATEVAESEGAKKKVLLVLVTSDRGLCGGFNGNIIKGAQRWILANQASYEQVTLSFVGRKGNEFFKTKKFKIGQYFAEAGGKATFAKARGLAAALVELYLSGEYDEVKFVFNEFKNAVTQQVVVEDFLPIKPADASSNDAAALVPNFIVKPSAKVVLEYLLEKNFAVQAFRILLESQAGEHGARMSAMENATKNAGDMIKKLTLQYNKQRQAGITKELLEIISGSESQKG